MLPITLVPLHVRLDPQDRQALLNRADQLGIPVHVLAASILAHHCNLGGATCPACGRKLPKK